MDIFGSLAIATEQPELNLINSKPYNRNENIISKKMIKHIFFQTIYQLTVLIIFLFCGKDFIILFY